jgi:hypothetical protein
METLKDTKQHWRNIGGHQVVSRKCQGSIRKKVSFLSLFSGNKGHQEDIK